MTIAACSLTFALRHSTHTCSLVGSGPHRLSADGVLGAEDDAVADYVELECHSGQWCITARGSGEARINGLMLIPGEHEPVSHGDFIQIETRSGQFSLDDVADAIPAEPPAGALEPESPRRNWTDDEATRASIFLRLDGGEATRELGWSEFADRYTRIIRGFAMSRGLDWSDAEDVVQDVMISIMRRSRPFTYDTAKGQFRGYLRTMTLNALRRMGRRSTRERDVRRQSAEQQDQARIEQMDWDLQWTAHLLSEGLRAVRGRFDPRTLEAFERIAIRGEPSASVAQALQMTPEAARQAKSRVTAALRDHINALQLELG